MLSSASRIAGCIGFLPARLRRQAAALVVGVLDAVGARRSAEAPGVLGGPTAGAGDRASASRGPPASSRSPGSRRAAWWRSWAPCSSLTFQPVLLRRLTVRRRNRRKRRQWL